MMGHRRIRLGMAVVSCSAVLAMLSAGSAAHAATALTFVGLRDEGVAPSAAPTVSLPRIDLLSVRNPGGGPSNGGSSMGTDMWVSGDGRTAEFYWCDGLLVDPSPMAPNCPVYRRNLVTGRTSVAARGPGGSQITGRWWDAVTSADGRWSALTTDDTAVVPEWTTRVRYSWARFVSFQDKRSLAVTTFRTPLVASTRGPQRAHAVVLSIDRTGRHAVVKLNPPRYGDEPTWWQLATVDRVTGQWRMLTAPSAPQTAGAGYSALAADPAGTYFEYEFRDDAGASQKFLMDLSTFQSRPLALGGPLTRDGRSMFVSRYVTPGNFLETQIQVLDTATLQPKVTYRFHDGSAVGASDLSGRKVVLYVPEPNGDPMFPGQFYRWDRDTGERVRINHGMDGGRSRGGATSMYPNGMSDDGNVVVFGSLAWNLVPHDWYDPGFSSSWDVFAAIFPTGASSSAAATTAAPAAEADTTPVDPDAELAPATGPVVDLPGRFPSPVSHRPGW